MKYISKNNGVLYNSIDENIISFHIKELKSLIVCVSDERQFIKNEFGEIIDNFTLEEAREGLKAVEKALKGVNDELLKAYVSFYAKNINNETEALNVEKELKKAEITQKRDEAINGGVEYKGKVYQSGEKDRNLLTSTTSLFSITKQAPKGFKWIAKDNEAVSFTLEDLINLGGLMANAVNLHTMKARDLKDKVEKAKNIKELEAILVEF